MAKNATLTFGMDLSDFDKAMKSINKQATSLSDQINKATQGAMQAYKNGLSELKANPLQGAKINADLANLKENIKKAVDGKEVQAYRLVGKTKEDDTYLLIVNDSTVRVVNADLKLESQTPEKYDLKLK